MAGPVTIGDLKRSGQLLEIGCQACNRHTYVDPGSLALADDLPVPAVAARLVCSVCGARNRPNKHPIWARPDARAPGVL